MFYELILFDGATKMSLPSSFKTKFWKKENAIKAAKNTIKFFGGNVAVVKRFTGKLVFVCEN